MQASFDAACTFLRNVSFLSRMTVPFRHELKCRDCFNIKTRGVTAAPKTAVRYRLNFGLSLIAKTAILGAAIAAAIWDFSKLAIL